MELETITTERLILRKFTPKDFKFLFENHAEDEVKQILGLATHEEYLTEKNKSDGGYETYRTSMALFKISLKETGEVIGGCGFHNWFEIHNRAEVGYHLTRDEHKRKGYLTEALKAVLDYGFNKMNLNRIEACVGPENVASLSLVRKYGFIQEGYLREHFFRDGVLYDSIIFGLLKREYEAAKPYS